jgi:hypothetical protein
MTSYFISRRRIIYLYLVPALLVLGLTIRANSKLFPPLFAGYAPDILWALLVFAFSRLLLPRLTTSKVALIALGFSLFMECSQLYQAPWINDLRATGIGGLLLGFAFLWSDVACYIGGVALGAAFDWQSSVILKKLSKTEKVSCSRSLPPSR